jgi:hypothetical protein
MIALNPFLLKELTMFFAPVLMCLLISPSDPANPARKPLPVTAVEAAVDADGKVGLMIGHMVFFKLKDPTPEAKAKLVAACDKYLEEHEGVMHYSAGVIGDEFKREVNDRDFDVALHLVFKNKAAHDKYAVHPEHLKFIEENKETWAKVRVFDSEIAPRAKKAK